MGTMAPQITGIRTVCLAVCSCTHQRKHQSSASLAFVRGIHRSPVDSHHKGQVTRTMFPFDDVTMRPTCWIVILQIVNHVFDWSVLRITGHNEWWQSQVSVYWRIWNKASCFKTGKRFPHHWSFHYNDVIMSVMASQITGVSIAYSTVWSGVDQRKHQRTASLAFVRVIHRWPVDSPHKGPVMRKMFPFDDVIMWPVD